MCVFQLSLTQNQTSQCVRVRACSLRKVPAGARLLSSVRLGDAEGVPQRRYAGLQVELRGLRQVRLLTKVVEVEQRGPALHLSLHQGGRSDLQTRAGGHRCVPTRSSSVRHLTS